MTAETPGVVTCPKCRTALPSAVLNTDTPVPCPFCETPIAVAAFPSLFQSQDSASAAPHAAMDGEAGCFYHPNKEATTTCEACGRFLCALCDVVLVGKHLCPTCIETGKRKGRIQNIDRHRVLFDEVALTLAVLPLAIPFFGWFATLATAPMALFIGFRRWHEPSSIIPRTRFRLVLAMGLAVLEIAAWIALVIWFIRR